MTFQDYCMAHGVLLDNLPPIGRWVRCKTADKPKSRNGAVKWMGSHGFVQNHATMTDVAVWQSDDVTPAVVAQARKQAAHADAEIRAGQAKAAEKAEQILKQSRRTTHAYFERKGFPEEIVHVWKRDEIDVAAIPMWVGNYLVGLQVIEADGAKKFLYGQRTSNATHSFKAGYNGLNVVCEGYATALSVKAALTSMRRPYALHVCFSAGNMKKVSATLKPGLVIADNDESRTGELAAQAIGWPYWMSDKIGEDANDFHNRVKLFAFSQSLKKSIMLCR